MAIYVKYGNIKGDATHHAHKGSDGWWHAHSCNYSVSRGISTPTGSTQDRIPSHAHISEIVVTKTQNTASAAFFKEATVGEGVPCTIHFVQDGAQHGETYMELTLSQAMIAHWAQHSGGDRPTESLSFNFTKLEVKTNEYDAKGKSVTTKSYTFDVSTGKTQ